MSNLELAKVGGGLQRSHPRNSSFLQTRRAIRRFFSSFRKKSRPTQNLPLQSPQEPNISPKKTVRKDKGGLNCFKTQKRRQPELPQNVQAQGAVLLQTRGDTRPEKEAEVIVETPPEVLTESELPVEAQKQLFAENLQQAVNEGVQRHKKILFELTDGQEFFTEKQLTEFHGRNLETIQEEFSSTYTNLPADVMEEYSDILTSKIEAQLPTYLQRYEYRKEELKKKVKMLTLKAEGSYDESLEKEVGPEMSKDEYLTWHEELKDRILWDYQEEMTASIEGIAVDMIDSLSKELEFKLQERLEDSLRERFLEEAPVEQDGNNGSNRLSSTFV